MCIRDSNNSGNTSLNIENRYDSASGAINFRLRTSGTTVTAMTVLGSGNVGIGTTSPATKLHLYGTDSSIQLEATGATDNAWTYYKNANKTYLVGVRGSSSHAFTVYDLTEDHSRFRVNSDGGVAIGEDNVGYAGQIPVSYTHLTLPTKA